MEAANLTTQSNEGKVTMRHYQPPVEDDSDPIRLGKLLELGFNRDDIKKSIKILKKYL